MKRLYDFLESNDLANNHAVIEKIPKLSRKKIESIIFGIIERIHPFDVPSDKPSMFSFIANSTLGGAPFPCRSRDCRLANIEQLARFSALYSDRIIIPSPFDYYLRAKRVEIYRLINDILILLYLRPLVEKRIIMFSIETKLLCRDCMDDFIQREAGIKENLAILRQVLTEEYLQNLKCTLVWDGKPEIHIQGPESYGFHGNIIRTSHNPSETLLALLNKDKPVELPPEIVSKEVIPGLISYIINDSVYNNIVVHKTEYTYLTHRDIDVQVINALLGEERSINSQELITGLAHELPIIANASLDNILKLRKEEGEAFLVYRDAVSLLLRTAHGIKKAQLREAYEELILPELNKINLTITNNKKAVTSSLKDDLLILGGLISFGLYAGIINPEASKLITSTGVCTAGGGAFLAAEYAKIKRLFNEPDAVKENKYYFLWKLQKTTERTSDNKFYLP